MHEFSLIQNVFSVLEEVAKKNRLRIVTKVKLKVGRLRQVMPNFLRFAFENISKGTIAEGASLEVEMVPITVLCEHCKRYSSVDENFYICSYCHTGKLQIISGKEFVLESIEGDT